jgi:hypothetical protein
MVLTERWKINSIRCVGTITQAQIMTMMYANIQLTSVTGIFTDTTILAQVFSNKKAAIYFFTLTKTSSGWNRRLQDPTGRNSHRINQDKSSGAHPQAP